MPIRKSWVIYNEDCKETMKKIADSSIDVVLTSPPYNTGRPSTSERSRSNSEGRYDVHLDTMSQTEYCDWVVSLFGMFDSILKKDGVVLWNVSYGTDLSVNTDGFSVMWLSIADIIRKSKFTVADRIIWKKNCALPNNTSSNKLTRIVEDVFVFCRKEELKTFKMSKEVKSVSKTD